MKYIKKVFTVVLSLIMVLGIAGCGAEKESNSEIIGGADEPTTIFLEPDSGEEKMKKVEDEAEANDQDVDSVNDAITDEQALSAIKNYCHFTNPDLEAIEKAGEYPVYWEVVSGEDNEIVVLFRSYTGAEVRYYIDPASGDTYVTEFVSGITPEEERTDENFNVKDYLSNEDISSDQNQSLTGTWVTASMGYEYYGTTQAEYYVKFTDTEISYGHMKDDEFILDHSDKIVSLEKVTTGGCMVKAETANGGQYTYRTSKGDDDTLEYYDTWNEDDFPKKYRGGASLSRIF